jgi:carbamoyl-phosphate synthase small subunit
MRGVLSSVDRNVESLIRKAQAAPMLRDVDLVADVTSQAKKVWTGRRPPRWRSEHAVPEGERPKCVAFDFGTKRNILNLLVEAGFEVTVVPASCTAEDALAMEPDAFFLSNGPGDPEVPSYAIDTVKSLIGRKPMFGICLGHQILGLALGGRTYKLKFGHRGINQPVQNLDNGKIEITSQNHGFVVDLDSLKHQAVEITHVNLNDGTLEGFRHKKYPAFAVQYHPEASPGPHDARYLFDTFANLMKDHPSHA